MYNIKQNLAQSNYRETPKQRSFSRDLKSITSNSVFFPKENKPSKD